MALEGRDHRFLIERRISQKVGGGGPEFGMGIL